MTTKAEETSGRKPPKMTSRAEFEAQYNPADEVRHLRSALSKAEGALESYREEHGSLKVLFEELKECVEPIEPLPVEYKPTTEKKVSSPVVHASHRCDWHEGAVQESDEIEGFGEFSPQILREYLRNLRQDELQWTELCRSNYKIDECWHGYTGDLISGGIHPELLWTNAYPEPVQAIRAAELVALDVAEKAPHFKQLVVDFVTADNHGRLTKKPQASEAGLNCWGYVIACHAKELLRDHTNVVFNIHPLIKKVVSVAGRRYLLTHGDRVRGWAGFPYYGIQRLVGREATKRMRHGLKELRAGETDVRAAIRTQFDRVVMGHFHAPLKHPWYWIGGSASGTTAYDHAEGRESDPIQCSWLVHPQHGEFNTVDWTLRRN